MDIATVVLPPLLTGLKAFDEGLKFLAAHMPAQGSPGGPPAVGTFGAALRPGMLGGALAGALIGGGIGAAGFGAGAIPGAIAGAAYGAFAGGAFTGGQYLLGALPPSRGFTTPAGAAGAGGGTTLNVTVKAETDDPEGLAHRVARHIVEMLHTAGTHNQAQGQGALDSAWTAGSVNP
jgi:hypothetical protein